jgi:hypothetical protein
MVAKGIDWNLLGIYLEFYWNFHLLAKNNRTFFWMLSVAAEKMLRSAREKKRKRRKRERERGEKRR